MPSNSSTIGASPGSFIEASNSSSSSSSSMNPQQKALDQCIARVNSVIQRVQLGIQNEYLSPLNCPITQEFPENPVVTNCGHIFEETAIQHWKDQGKTCPSCRTSLTHLSPILGLRDFAEKRQKDFILTCSKFKKADPEMAGDLISTAKKLIAEEDFSEASNLLSTALKYTSSSEDYSLVPKLYDAWKDSDKASLSRLYLSLYQLQEGKTDEALKTLGGFEPLSCCEENIVDPALLGAFQLHAQHGSTQDHIQLVKDLLEDDVKIKKAEDKIFLCKQILALDPYQFDVHEKLIALTTKTSEKRRLCSEAAALAKQVGNTALEEIFLEGSKIPPTPTSITKEQWMNADTMELPPYPPALEEFLEEQDPYDRTKTKRETHIVVPLFPDIMDENGSTTPFTLASLEQLDKNLDGAEGFVVLWNKIPAKDLVAEREFRYGVMMKDVIPESRGKTYEEQEALLLPGYRMPKAFDAARAILWEYRRTKTRLFTQNPLTHTRCSDDPIQGRRLIVGGFTPSSLSVLHSNPSDDSEDIGVASWREF